MEKTIQLQELIICRMGLGTNRITNSFDSHQILRHACDIGINFFDTANIYQDGQSELAIAAALKPYAKHLLIATKGGFKKQASGIYIPEGHPDKLRENIEASLMRLELDHIDLYQLHRVDPNVPLEESLDALKALQNEGKIRFIGLSEVTVEQIEQARSVIDLVSVQNRYNVYERNFEAVADYCHKQNILFIPFYPLGSTRHLFPETLMQKLNVIANQYQCTPYQVALAWLLNRSKTMLPIPGTLSKKHLEENMATLSLQFSETDLVF